MHSSGRGSTRRTIASLVAMFAAVSGLPVVFVVASQSAAFAVSSGSQTFVYTPSGQNFVVPAGVTSVAVDAFGAQGVGSGAPEAD